MLIDKLTGNAENGIIHLINSGTTALDGTGQQLKEGIPAIKPFWEITDEEVDKWGRSLRTYVLRQPNQTDREYKAIRIKSGEYRVVLSIGDRMFTKPVVILKDHWYK